MLEASVSVWMACQFFIKHYFNSNHFYYIFIIYTHHYGRNESSQHEKAISSVT